MHGIRVGAFEIEERIGKGAMAEVWSGTERSSGTPVALKVLTADHARDPLVLEALRTDVRAIARLNHPHVVWIFDQGVVDRAAERDSEGSLVAGSPFLVMEKVTGGTLSRNRPRTWPEVRRVLTAILHALAHAHARGVIHRDLKPANILLGAPTDLRPGLKLTDFGIAWAGGQHDEAMPVGTPRYMAPEQFRLGMRNQGPWTDIYALGCVAWKLVTRRALFRGLKGGELARAHCTAPRPILEPAMEVPRGLEQWLHNCLAKWPGARYRRAADALHALLEIGDRVGPASLHEDTTEHQNLEWLAALPTQPTLEVAAQGLQDPWCPPDPPPLPVDWRSPLPVVPPALLGAGRGLWGLRAPPPVGRAADRDLLWALLRSQSRTPETHVVLVRGDRGGGRTHLLDWFHGRSHEVGATYTLMTRCRADAASGEALDDLLHGVLAWQELLPGQRAKQAEHALRALGLGNNRTLEAAHQLAHHREDGDSRYGLTKRIVEDLARLRTVLILLDDVHLDPEALGFVHHLATGDRRHRVIVVCTAPSNGLSDGDEARVREIAKLEGSRSISLGPLSEGSIGSLLSHMLPLHPGLAQRIAERAAGNPGFALTILGDFVERDLLATSPSGLVLGRGTPTALPADQRDAWNKRVQRLLAGMPRGAKTLLERAAILGSSVDQAEWEASGPISAAASKVRAAIRDRLLQVGLAAPTRNGWRFTTLSLREVVVEEARQSARWTAHHRALASMLRERGPVGERLGIHLLEAGDWEGSAPFLREAVLERRREGGPQPALALVDRVLDRWSELDAPQDHPPIIELRIRKVSFLRMLSGVVEARNLAQRLLQPTVASGDPDLVGQLVVEIARCDRASGHRDHATQLLEQSIESGVRDPYWRGLMHYELSHLALDARDEQEFERHAIRALEDLAESPRRLARAHQLLLELDLAIRTIDDPAVAMERARELAVECRAVRHVDGLRTALGHQAEAAKQLGKFDDAVRLYEEALDLDMLRGHPLRTAFSLLNMGVCQAIAGRYEEARTYLATANTRWPHLAIQGPVAVTLAYVEARSQRWPAFDDALQAAAAYLRSPHRPERDAAWMLAQTAVLCRSADRAEAADHLATLADAEEQALGTELGSIIQVSRD